MHALSSRSGRIQPSSTLAISQKAAELRAEGVDVLSFSAGEPDFVTPAHIMDACEKALRAGHTGYPPAAGLAKLREAIADKLRRENGLGHSAGDIVVSCGAKQSLFNAFMALLDAGDEVLVPTPYWVSYPQQIALADGKAVFVPTSDGNGFAPSAAALEAATTPKTRAIVYSSPSNPAGTIYDDAALKTIGEWAKKHNAWIISDEIYEKLVFGGKSHRSVLNVMPELAERTIIVNGFSKAWAMTGWRIGYTASSTAVAKAMARMQGHINTNTAHFLQHAAVAALTGPQEPMQQMVKAFDRRRKLMVAGLESLPGVAVPAPEGAFYAFPNVSAFYGREIAGRRVRNSIDFAAVCLEEAHVALVPGDAFGMDAHVRLSYACSDADIEKGCARLRELLPA